MTQVEWIITTCGNQKLPYPAPCEQMYTGPFAQGQMKAAQAIRPTKGHIILSNKYGYMKPGTVISPYDSRWGRDDTLDEETLRGQIKDIGIVSGDRVMHLGGVGYCTVSERVMPEGVEIYWLPQMLPKKGIGYQGQMYKTLQLTKNLPTGWESTLRLR